MRINKYVAQATGISRRAADAAIAAGEVFVNGAEPQVGQDIAPTDSVTFRGRTLQTQAFVTIMINKPAGLVCSRNGQGSDTVYDLLPPIYHQLKPVGRLDKYSSGLLLLTNDGALADSLTHPRYAKTKVYQVRLNRPLEPLHQQMINDIGITLDDGPSKLQLEKLSDDRINWTIRMQEGRNRQIRRTFESLGYAVRTLHRTHFGKYELGKLESGKISQIK